MKLVALSDTHRHHRKVQLPEGDILIHAGDWTSRGERTTYLDAYNWLLDQKNKYKHIIVIMGNHDFYHNEFASMLKSSGIVYLENSSVVIDGIKFHGTPNVSRLKRWAFNDTDDPTCWDKIPDDVEVLISHTPPLDFLDEINHYGSLPLRKKVDDLMNKKLKLNIFGHCHADQGKQIELINKEDKKVLFANVCICDVLYKPVGKAMVIDI